jgi:hypothetical protein
MTAIHNTYTDTIWNLRDIYHEVHSKQMWESQWLHHKVPSQAQTLLSDNSEWS